MYLCRDQLQWTARAPAKLNLFLELLGRRDDGFHELETLMVPIRLADSLFFTVTPPAADGRPGPILLNVRTCLPVRLPSPLDEVASGSDNLVVRALERLRERSNCRLGAQVELVKRIPAAAGLGGGSSDAAVALQIANRAWRLGWPPDRLAELAAELGSDVPFFLAGRAAVCRGRGERVEPLPAMPPLHFVVVKPPHGLHTGEVYRAHDMLPDTPNPKGHQGSSAIVGELSRGRWGELTQWMGNHLQAAAASLSPGLKQVQRAFAELDFLAHQLSGSGSAYFGVCRHAQHARRLANILKTRQLGLVYATRSCQ